MHRFYLPPEECRGEIFTLSERESHHGLHVLRLQKGEEVTVLDGAGGHFRCVVLGWTRRMVELQVIETRVFAPPLCAVTLVQAMPRAKAFDAIVQKATELGASRIVPVLSERVVTKVTEETSLTKADHWRWTAIDSIKQCGSPWLPRIDPPVTLGEFIAHREKFDLSLVASLREGSPHPRVWFTEFARAHGRRPAGVALWIGPEGDFTPDEMDQIETAGAHPMTLGPLVLRADTAAIYCLSVVNYEVQAPASPSLA
jgi:16S rRNA (uracil1498-N3)-methyltransferase